MVHSKQPRSQRSIYRFSLTDRNQVLDYGRLAGQTGLPSPWLELVIGGHQWIMHSVSFKHPPRSDTTSPSAGMHLLTSTADWNSSYLRKFRQITTYGSLVRQRVDYAAQKKPIRLNYVYTKSRQPPIGSGIRRDNETKRKYACALMRSGS